ncbi:MAG: DUF1330 domain-containing protein [Acidobacteria bacterium]|nr:DUF1330 domain-containing protein [Acidobacteriota bacterium]
MAGYVIVQAEIIDIERFRKYLAESPGTIAKFGGKYLARAGKTIVFEGEQSDKRLVIIEFPSLEKAKEWYHSEEYTKVKALRKGAATGSLIAIEGC